MVIDHQKKSTRIQASLFTASDRENSASTPAWRTLANS